MPVVSLNILFAAHHILNTGINGTFISAGQMLDAIFSINSIFIELALKTIIPIRRAKTSQRIIKSLNTHLLTSPTLPNNSH